MLTEDQAQKYIASGGVHCPHCGSEDITGQCGVQTDSGVAWQRIYCERCTAEWTDIYRLVDINETEEG